MCPPTANPMLRNRFLVEVSGSAKKFHILVGESSDRELRDRRDVADEGFDKGTVCPKY